LHYLKVQAAQGKFVRIIPLAFNMAGRDPLTTRRSADRRLSRGQAATEFAISSIVLLLILLGLVDFSRVFYFDTGLHGAAREGARHGAWFDTPNRRNPYLDDTDIKAAVDQSLAGVSGVTTSQFAGNCPTPADGNTYHNPPFDPNTYYPPLGVYNKPNLYICYNNNPGLDLQTAPTDNSYRLQDLNVILLMNYGLATGFMQAQIGKNIPVAAFAHIIIQGK
jgi:Flp pilus assembly protein TadG